MMSMRIQRTSVLNIPSVPLFNPAVRCTEPSFAVRSGIFGLISPTAVFLSLEAIPSKHRLTLPTCEYRPARGSAGFQ